MKASSGTYFDSLFEKDFVWTEVDDAGGITGQALLAMQNLLSAVRSEVPVSKREYVEPLRSLAAEVRSKRSGFKATAR